MKLFISALSVLFAATCMADPVTAGLALETVVASENFTHSAITPQFHYDHCYLAYDTDIVGCDIGNTKSDRTNCCQLCRLDDRCQAFTWTNYNGGTCWFKDSTVEVVYSAGAVSGQLMPLRGPWPHPTMKCDMRGNDIGSVKAGSYEKCYNHCSVNSQRRAFTWSFYAGGTCWLKSGPSPCVAVPGTVSDISFK